MKRQGSLETLTQGVGFRDSVGTPLSHVKLNREKAAGRIGARGYTEGPKTDQARGA